MFTPTEAAAIAALYAILITMAIYRELDARQLFEMVRLTMRDTAVVLIIVAAAALYAWFLVFAQIPQTLVAGIRGLDLDPFTILLALNLFLLVVGLFMETNAAITVFTPMLLPVAVAAGVDPVHFGITPPVGMVLFAVAKVAELPLNAVVRAIVPFYLPLFIALMLVTYVPQISLFLPSLFR